MSPVVAPAVDAQVAAPTASPTEAALTPDSASVAAASAAGAPADPSTPPLKLAALGTVDCRTALSAAKALAASERGSGAHGADMPKHNEHVALLALVDVARATHLAVRSGAWSDAANVWCAVDAQGNALPGAAPGNAARVWVMPGVQLAVDGDLSAAALHTVRVSGTLAFTSNKPTVIKAATFVVDPTGTWQQGPIPAGVTSRVIIADEGAIDRVEDPFALGRGFVSHGKVAIEGAETTAFVSRAAFDVKLQPTADAHVQHLGAVSQVTLDAVPVNWRVGGTLVFPSTDWNGDSVTRTLTAISGNQLSFDPPLPDWKLWLPVTDTSLRAHVGYLDRNVVFTSENKVDQYRGGHVMFMHSPNVSVKYAQFEAMGRTDKITDAVNDPVVDAKGVLAAGTGTNPRGRYAVHFHRTDMDTTAPPALVKGCTITAPRSWGAVNHDSYVAFDDNIVTDAKGAAFVTEIGTEIGRFARNMVVNVTRDPNEKLDLQSTNLDWGRDGAAYFMVGFATPIDGGVIAGVKDAWEAIEMFAWRAAVLDDKGNPANSQFASANLDPAVAQQVAKGRATVGNDEVPFTVKNVTAYSTRTLMSQHAHLGGFLNTVDNVVIYGAYGGIGDQYSPGLTVTNSKFYGAMFNGAFGNDWKTQLRVENTAIKGYAYGIIVPQNGTTYFKDLDLANVVNLTLLRVDQYQWAESAPRSQVIAENVKFSAGTRYGYWVPGASTAWTDILMPSDNAPLPNVEPDYDERISLFFSRAGDASDRRHQTLFKPWNLQINGKQLYSDDQKPDFRVHGTGFAGIDGKSNSELNAFCKMSMMDQMMPAALAAEPLAADGTYIDRDGIRIWGGRTGALNPNTAHFLHGSLDPYNKVNPTLTVTDQSDGNAVVVKQPNNPITPGKQNVFCLTVGSGPEKGRVFHWISDTL